MFELYHSLEAQVKVSDKVDISLLKDSVSRLDVEGHTFIFALVYYYNISEGGKSPPQINEKLVLDLSAIPDKLQKILQRFSEMHLKKMQETLDMQKAARVAALDSILQ